MVEAVGFFFLSPSHHRISATQLPIGTSLVDSQLGECIPSLGSGQCLVFLPTLLFSTHRWCKQDGGKLRFSFLSLCKLVGALLYLFTTETCEIPLVCLKPSRYGINRVKILGRVLCNWNLDSKDGRHVMVRWIYCNGVCLSFDVASPSPWNK